MHDLGIALLFLAALLAIMVAGVSKIMSERPKQTSKAAIDFLALNFIALCDESRKPSQLVTIKSLTAARARFLENAAEIAELIANISSIGHDIDEDTDAKAAAAMTISAVAPYAATVMAASFVVFGIDRNDIRETREQAADPRS
jgi:hypothetical protein